MQTKFIFVTGGVMSGLGKGVVSSSICKLLQLSDQKVSCVKIDPYLNYDAGTMNPIAHGEVFVTDDGGECDMDIGNYERFLNQDIPKSHNITTAQIYSSVIESERKGEYLGACVQIIPHVTDEIKNRIKNIAKDEELEILIVECGGTVGDIESLPFLEAIRQKANELGRERAMFIHLTLLPHLSAAGEVKTKPTQHSVKELQSVGIQADILLCRSDRPIPADARRKIALFCNVVPERVISAPDVETIYEVPLVYHEQGFDVEVCKHFGIETTTEPNLSRWNDIVERIKQPEGKVTIAVVGKYTELPDAYKSLAEALGHGGIANNVGIEMRWIDSEIFESEDAVTFLEDVDGILVPGGFGERGSEGKVAAVQFAREHQVPYFGICFGMQMAVIEVARNLAGLENAGSTEFGNTPQAVVGLLTEWKKGDLVEQRDENNDLGGTMRLGAYPCQIVKETLVHEIYGSATIEERHRHRYEVNINYVDQLKAAGLVFSGMSPDGELPEIVELPGHPWFIGVQFHPELKSKPFEPHPLFTSFIKAAVDRSRLV